MKTNTAMTIYNQYVDDGNEAFQRFVVSHVQWENNKGANVRATGGYLAANQATIFIPFSEGSDYLQPVEWLASVEDGTWTLKAGDIVVKGIADEDIDEDFTVTMLKAAYNDVFAIVSIDTMDYGSANMRHWEVGVK